MSAHTEPWVDRTQCDRSHYRHSYNSKGRLASYWHQVDQVLRSGARDVLEVGVGCGYVANALREEGIRIWTLDIDQSVSPRIVGSVRRLPLSDRAVDLVVCCQVLEHMPFEFFGPTVRELLRASRLGIVISLPDRTPYIQWFMKVPGLKSSGIISVPVRLHWRYRLDPQHYWEIGVPGTSFRKVAATVSRFGGRLAESFRVPEMPWHRFLRLTHG